MLAPSCPPPPPPPHCAWCLVLQECAYKLMRTPIVQPHPTAERLKGAFNNSVWMGIIPPR